MIHDRRQSGVGEITTLILGTDAVIDLSPPGYMVSVEALLDI
ncbi:MAG TPA: hypothetical protein VIN77_13060 [Aurantimonas sp.]|nr:hypothetical protein [Aurantimonas marianensis]